LNYIDLYNKFRYYDIGGNAESKYLIETIESYIQETYKVSDETLKELNEQILTYMVANFDDNYDDFIDYLLRSKLVKSLPKRLPIDELKVKSKNELEEILNVIKEIR